MKWLSLVALGLACFGAIEIPTSSARAAAIDSDERIQKLEAELTKLRASVQGIERELQQLKGTPDKPRLDKPRLEDREQARRNSQEPRDEKRPPAGKPRQAQAHDGWDQLARILAHRRMQEFHAHHGAQGRHDGRRADSFGPGGHRPPSFGFDPRHGHDRKPGGDFHARRDHDDHDRRHARSDDFRRDEPQHGKQHGGPRANGPRPNGPRPNEPRHGDFGRGPGDFHGHAMHHGRPEHFGSRYGRGHDEHSDRREFSRHEFHREHFGRHDFDRHDSHRHSFHRHGRDEAHASLSPRAGRPDFRHDGPSRDRDDARREWHARHGRENDGREFHDRRSEGRPEGARAEGRLNERRPEAGPPRGPVREGARDGKPPEGPRGGMRERDSNDAPPRDAGPRREPPRGTGPRDEKLRDDQRRDEKPRDEKPREAGPRGDGPRERASRDEAFPFEQPERSAQPQFGQAQVGEVQLGRAQAGPVPFDLDRLFDLVELLDRQLELAVEE
ncbi:MAG: hypothetical protein K8U03_04350 [Planctomycetia bacterium]|nr:hypothetical protein [Planctomycetia bacterium]